MGIATIHYLAMNATDGKVADPGAEIEGIEYTYYVTSLQADTEYTIVWGDGSSNTSVTTEPDGSGSQTHIFASVGSYVVQVKSGNKVVAKNIADVGYNDGSIGTTGGTLATVSKEFFILSLVPDGEYTIHWGDSESDVVVMDGEGELTIDHTFNTADTFEVEVWRDKHIVASLVVTVTSAP